MSKDYGGVVNDLVTGKWKDPRTGQPVSIDIRSIVIKETLDGMEGELVRPLHKNEKMAIVSDRYTFEVLGRRIGSALRSEGFAIEEIVWKKPHAAIESVEELRHLTRHWRLSTSSTRPGFARWGSCGAGPTPSATAFPSNPPPLPTPAPA